MIKHILIIAVVIFSLTACGQSQEYYRENTNNWYQDLKATAVTVENGREVWCIQVENAVTMPSCNWDAYNQGE